MLVARGERDGALTLGELIETAPGGAVEDACRRITPDTTAKLLFTSGSTGTPKGVVNTHRMLCSNQAMLQRIWPFLADEPPVLVDWLPWSHTFGANHNLNLVLFNGGTLYIDDGKPAPPLFPRTIAALDEISPTLYFNVPAGFALLAPALESDPDAGAQLLQPAAVHVLRRRRAARRAGRTAARRSPQQHADHEVPLTSSWGTTETAPAATSAHFADAAIGLHRRPAGRQFRSSSRPSADKLEIRVKRPQRDPRLLPGAASWPTEPSTRRATTAPATRWCSSMARTRTRGSASTAGSPRTSSC